MQKIKTTVKKTIAYLAKKSANMEANTACPCIRRTTLNIIIYE